MPNYKYMKTSEFIYSICEFAKTMVVVDDPPMKGKIDIYDALKKTIIELKKEPKLPSNIHEMSKEEINAELQKLKNKSNNISQWMDPYLKNRQTMDLLKIEHPQLLEAYSVYQMRFDRKIRMIQDILKQKQ